MDIPEMVDEDATAVRAIYASWSANFTYSEGSYSLSSAQSDLGDISGNWQTNNVSIYSNQMRVRIPANSISSQPASDGSGNTVRFRVRSNTGFSYNGLVFYSVDGVTLLSKKYPMDY